MSRTTWLPPRDYEGFVCECFVIILVEGEGRGVTATACGERETLVVFCGFSRSTESGGVWWEVMLYLVRGVNGSQRNSEVRWPVVFV